MTKARNVKIEVFANTEESKVIVQMDINGTIVRAALVPRNAKSMAEQLVKASSTVERRAHSASFWEYTKRSVLEATAEFFAPLARKKK
jgi:hypothetical protein